MKTFVARWVPPDHNIVGMVVHHGEAFSITEKLTVWESGKAIYRLRSSTRMIAPSPRATSCAAATTGYNRGSAS
jgi:homospermidine synthase